jgi:uncharacterized protein YxjI
MEIDINQKKIALGDKYTVFVDRQQAYTAATETFRLLAVLHLYNHAGACRVTINKRTFGFKATYDITFFDNTIAAFRTRSFWKNHHECRYGADTFDIYGHRGRKYSVFKNSMQVAWWDKKAVTWFEGDNYKITADRDSNPELLIAFCLIIDNYRSKNNGNNTMTIDLGSIVQAKKFDPAWQPKY